MKIDNNTSVEEVKEKQKDVLEKTCSIENNESDNGEQLRELFDIARTHRIQTPKPKFSEKDFILLLLVKLFENGITKIDTMELKHVLANYYSIEEYSLLFEDISLKEQIEGSFVELDDALLFAQFIGMLSNPIQGTNVRITWGKEIDGLYSEEYVTKMNSLVSEIELKNIKSEISHPISLLDHDVIPKIIELQGVILERKTKSLSIEKMIDFLNSAMNYGKFQIWLFDCELNGVKLTINDKIRKFLEETSIEEILKIYDIEYEYDNSLIKKEEQESPVNPIVDKYPKLANACAQYPTIQLKVNEPPVQVEQGPVKKLTHN